MVLVMGLMSLMTMALASMFDTQLQTTRALERKLTILDRKRALMDLTIDAIQCTKNFEGKNIGSGSTYHFSELAHYNTDGSKFAAIFRTGQALIAGASVMISDISLTNIVRHTSGTEFTANLQVSYDDPSARTGRAQLGIWNRPIVVDGVSFRTDPSNPSVIVSCANRDGTRSLAGQTCAAGLVMVGFNVDGSLNCQAASAVGAPTTTPRTTTRTCEHCDGQCTPPSCPSGFVTTGQNCTSLPHSCGPGANRSYYTCTRYCLGN